MGATPKTAAVLRRALAYASRYPSSGTSKGRLQPCGYAWVSKHCQHHYRFSWHPLSNLARSHVPVSGGGLNRAWP